MMNLCFGKTVLAFGRPIVEVQPFAGCSTHVTHQGEGTGTKDRAETVARYCSRTDSVGRRDPTFQKSGRANGPSKDVRNVAHSGKFSNAHTISECEMPFQRPPIC